MRTRPGYRGEARIRGSQMATKRALTSARERQDNSPCGSGVQNIYGCGASRITRELCVVTLPRRCASGKSVMLFRCLTCSSQSTSDSARALGPLSCHPASSFDSNTRFSRVRLHRGSRVHGRKFRKGFRIFRSTRSSRYSNLDLISPYDSRVMAPA